MNTSRPIRIATVGLNPPGVEGLRAYGLEVPSTMVECGACGCLFDPWEYEQTCPDCRYPNVDEDETA